MSRPQYRTPRRSARPAARRAPRTRRVTPASADAPGRTDGAVTRGRPRAGGRPLRRRRPEKARRPGRPGDPAPPGELPPGWEAALADALAFLRRRLTGDYEVDEFGFDPDLTDNVVLPAAAAALPDVVPGRGHRLHNVPDEGGALVVANHSGTVPLDALMTSVALHDDHPAHRHLRMLGADLVFRLPVVGQLGPQGRAARWPATPTPSAC